MDCRCLAAVALVHRIMTDSNSPKPRRRLLRRQDDGVDSEVAMRELSFVTLIAGLVIGAAFIVAYHFVRPAPPNSFVNLTGHPAGAYHLFTQR